MLIVPDDEFGRYLTDRGPKFSDAVRHVRSARAEDFPLLILGFRHDGPDEPLAKQFKTPQNVSEPDRATRLLKTTAATLDRRLDPHGEIVRAFRSR